jgi:predicted O-methyltransferase YrrM
MSDTHFSAVEPAIAYAEGFLPKTRSCGPLEHVPTRSGSARSAPVPGRCCVSLAASVNARSVVEIGTGAGVSGIWLLRGMRSDGTLTTIDVEAEHLRLARRTYADAGMAPSRSRLITGRALDVLPRLTDSAYDLVFCDADRREGSDYLVQAMRCCTPAGSSSSPEHSHTGRWPTRRPAGQK